MNLASNLSWCLLSCIFIWQGFISTKPCKGSVSRLHTWAFPGSRVWKWAVQVLELKVCVCPFMWRAPAVCSPQLGSDAGLRSSGSSSRALWEKGTSLGKKQNRPGNGHAEPFWVAGSCCWQHWLRMLELVCCYIVQPISVREVRVFQGYLWHIGSHDGEHKVVKVWII